MKRIRKANEDLNEMLSELKIGDDPIYDSVTNYEITKVPNGFVYKNEYVGLVFVPDGEQKKLAPKPQTMMEQKIDKPVRNSMTKSEQKRVIEK